MDNKYPINKQKHHIDYTNINKNPFEYIENKIENIVFPIILKKFSSRFINDGELEKLKKYILNNYYDKLNNDIIDILSYKIKIPYYLYSKIFLRIYTSGCEFYRDLNVALSKNNFRDFKQFIFILYYGLIRNLIKNAHDTYLYRLINIDLDVYNEIINSPRLVLTRTFDSFTKNKQIALSFLDYFKRPNTRAVLFVVNPLKTNSNITVTNIDTLAINHYNEEEVIFLPFSGFEISEIKEEENYTIISLNYLNKYEKKINDYIDAQSKDKLEEFLIQLIQISQSSLFNNILPPESIDLIKDFGNKKNVLWIDQ